jgi:hypothetical protein
VEEDRKLKQSQEAQHTSAPGSEYRNEPSKARLREGSEAPQLRNWDAPEGARAFHVEKDQAGRTVSIEGWLQPRSGDRPAGDSQVQQGFRKDHNLQRNQDAYHVIAFQHGGPSVDTHGVDQVKANLIASDSTINRSFHAPMESRISNDLARGDKVYCKATISYGSDTSRNALPESVTYAYFVKDQAGAPKEHVVKQYFVRVEKTPGLPESNASAQGGVKMTAAEILKREKAPDFYKDKWKGQHPELPN